jgi:hypothetical protein
MRCEDVQQELEAFFYNDIDGPRKSQIQGHLDECQNCSQALGQLTRLSEVLQTWQGIEPSPMMYERLKRRIKAYQSSWGRIFVNPYARKVTYEFMKVAAVVVLTLLASHWLKKPSPEIPDGLTTINFYLKEHQDVMAQTVSANVSPPQPARMHVSQHDILYYEFLDDRPEFARPGIILRGPASQRKISSPEPPAISNGHKLTLSQARNAVNFDFVAPPRIHPGYILDSIRKIEDRTSLHFLYANGINTISLFEQPLEGEHRLHAQDFREYAVYQSKGRVGGTILAWSDDAVAFVLIGNTEMSRSMDMAQSISARNRRE